MRSIWVIVGLVTLGCGGLFTPDDADEAPITEDAQPVADALDEEPVAVEAPADFTCPEGTTMAGGALDSADQLWAVPVYHLTLDGSRWLPPDQRFEQKRLDNPELTTFDSGDAAWWCENQNGRRQGPFRQVGAAGAWIEGAYADGRPDGAWKGWFIHAQDEQIPAFEGGFDRGRMAGAWVWHCGPGCFLDVVVRGGFDKAVPDGKWEWYGDQLQAVATWSDGKLNGPWRHVWLMNEETGQFDDGRRVGLWVVKNEGRIISEIDHGSGSDGAPGGDAPDGDSPAGVGVTDDGPIRAANADLERRPPRPLRGKAKAKRKVGRRGDR